MLDCNWCGNTIELNEIIECHGCNADICDECKNSDGGVGVICDDCKEELDETGSY